MHDIIGGIETHCKALYPALADQAPDLAITILVRKRYSSATPAKLGNVDVKALPAPRGQGVEAFGHSFLALFYAWLRLRANIVHLHGIGPAILAPLARLMGMQVVVTHHAADFSRPKWGHISRAILRAGEAAAARFANRIICVSAALQKEFLARHPRAQSRTRTIRHGASLATPLTNSDILAEHGLVAGEYLLAVGRLERTKRYEDLLEAHRRVAPHALPLVFAGAEIGGQDYERSLRAMAGPNVHFLGTQSGAALTALYRGAARFLHPSGMEGFGLVILEALSAGVPVTVSDIAVHREFALPEECYVQVGDVSALTAIVRNTGPRLEPWPPAERIVSQHGHARAVGIYLDLFRSLLPPAMRVSRPAKSSSKSVQ